MDNIGFLKVFTTAGNALPIEDVNITISSENASEEKILYTAQTNESGIAGEFELLTPLEDISLKPPEKYTPLPYAKYNVKASKPSYYTVIFKDVPVFSKITSLQTIPMIPLPEGVISAEPIINFSEQPNL